MVRGTDSIGVVLPDVEVDVLVVFAIEVWPLPDLQQTPGKDVDGRMRLDALERLITRSRRSMAHNSRPSSRRRTRLPAPLWSSGQLH